MAIADKQPWVFAEPGISDNDHFFWVLGGPWCIFDSTPAVAAPSSASMASKLIATGMI